MTNEMAIETLEKMIADGLRPTPRDCVRLNAFGLRVDESQGKRVGDAMYLLPRVAWLAYGVFFRQPTVGHDIWLKSVSRFISSDDYETILALNCFALSRHSDALPDALDPTNVQRAASEYAASMACFTRDQLYAAVNYVRFGIDEAICEDGPAECEGENASDERITVDDCVAVGSLIDGVSYLWGLSLADIKRMTRAQLDIAIRQAIVAHGLSISKSAEYEALTTFNRVANEIRERLEKEMEGSKNGGKQ